MICKNCGKEYSVQYGSGNFCSLHCVRSYAGKQTDNRHAKVQPRKEYTCNVCHKTFLGVDLYKEHKSICTFKHIAKVDGWTCSICGSNFRTKELLREHKAIHRNANQKKLIYEQCSCKFCQRAFNNKCARTLHERFCYKNPNKEIKHLSEEHKKKIGETSKARHAGGYKIGKFGGTGKKGYYKGLYCMSTWELAWVVYQLEHGQNVEQCTDSFEYEMDGNKHRYTPDFIINGVYYEIKGWHRPDTDFKVNQFPKDKTLVLIEGKKQNKVYLDYAKNKYGNNFYEFLYEHKNIIKKEKIKLKEKRWKIIENSNIDFSKLGWVKQLAKLFGIASNKAGVYVKNNFPDFYKNCFVKR